MFILLANPITTSRIKRPLAFHVLRTTQCGRRWGVSLGKRPIFARNTHLLYDLVNLYQLNKSVLNGHQWYLVGNRCPYMSRASSTSIIVLKLLLGLLKGELFSAIFRLPVGQTPGGHRSYIAGYTRPLFQNKKCTRVNVTKAALPRACDAGVILPAITLVICHVTRLPL